MFNRLQIIFILAILIAFATTYIKQKYKVGNLQNKMEILNKELNLKKYENDICNLTLDKQNKAIKDLEIKSLDNKSKEKIIKVEKIMLKDGNGKCETNLKALEELFNASF